MVRTNHRNIISKRLVKEIDEFVVDELLEYEIEWDDLYIRDASIDLFNILMGEYKNEGYVSNFKCYSDDRNNTPEDENNQIFHLTIDFLQANCLARTVLVYKLGNGVT